MFFIQNNPANQTIGIAFRCLALIAIGMLWENLLWEGGLRWTGPLHHIALATLLVFGCLRLLPPIGQLGLGLFILINYFYLISSYQVAPYTDTNLKPIYPYGFQNNLLAYIDSLYLPGNKLFGNWDTYGLTSIIASLPVVLVGSLSVTWCLTKSSHKRYLLTFAAGAGIATGGFLISSEIPINHYLWTPSFALISIGVLLCLLVAFSILATHETLLATIGRNSLLFVLLLGICHAGNLSLINIKLALILFPEAMQQSGLIAVALLEVGLLFGNAWLLRRQQWYFTVNRLLRRLRGWSSTSTPTEASPSL
ncbi:hypothetical protein [Polystyrenella longa]|uniref:hypothetical protein n=1 Tax=Polystyrenella longa TaxID=2528007 RepID=UPI0011A28983|nr:hypothetical protein [Polystyrenella longa]